MKSTLLKLFSVAVVLSMVLPSGAVAAPTRALPEAAPTTNVAAPPPPQAQVQTPPPPGGQGAPKDAMSKLTSELKTLASKGGAEPVTVYILAQKGADLSKVAQVTEVRPYMDAQLVVAKVKPDMLGKMASNPGVISAQAFHKIQAPGPVTPREDSAKLTREQVKELRKEAAARKAAGAPEGFQSQSSLPKSINAPQDWHGKDLIGASAAWAKGYEGQGVNIAIIDSGVDFGNPDLEGTQATYSSGPYAGWPIALDPRSMREYYYEGLTSWDNYYDWMDYTWYADVYNVIHCTAGKEATFDFDADQDDDDETFTIAPEITALSKSGEVRWGIHPDEQLPDFVFGSYYWVPFILLDTTTAGVYDTVIADLNNDLWFDGNDDVADKTNPVLSQDLGAYLTDNTWVMTGTWYIYDWYGTWGEPPTWWLSEPMTTTYGPTATTAMTLPVGTWVWAPNHWTPKGATTMQDGIADVSGGMVYYIADGKLPVPGMDYLYPGWGPAGMNPIPLNGQLVAFMLGSYYAGGEDHGTLCASAAVANGMITDPRGAAGEQVQYADINIPTQLINVGIVGANRSTMSNRLTNDDYLRNIYSFNTQSNYSQYEYISYYDMLVVDESAGGLTVDEAAALRKFYDSGKPIILGMTDLDIADKPIQDDIQYIFGVTNARDGGFVYGAGSLNPAHPITAGVTTIGAVTGGNNHFEGVGATWVVSGTDGNYYVWAYEPTGKAPSVIMGGQLHHWYDASQTPQGQLVRNAFLWAAANLKGKGTSLFYDDFSGGTGNWAVEPLWHSDLLTDDPETSTVSLRPYPPVYTPTMAFNHEGTANYAGTVAGSLTLSPAVALPPAANGIELSFFSYEQTENSPRPIVATQRITVGVVGQWSATGYGQLTGDSALNAYTFVDIGNDFDITSTSPITYGALAVFESTAGLTITETDALKAFYLAGKPIVLGMQDVMNASVGPVSPTHVADISQIFGITSTVLSAANPIPVGSLSQHHPINRDVAQPLPDVTTSNNGNYYFASGAKWVVRDTSNQNRVMAYQGTARTVIMGSDLNWWHDASDTLVDNALIWAVEGIEDPRQIFASTPITIGIVGAFSNYAYNQLIADYGLSAYTFVNVGNNFDSTVQQYGALLVDEAKNGLLLTETQELKTFYDSGKPIVLGMPDVDDAPMAVQSLVNTIFGVDKARDGTVSSGWTLDPSHPITQLVGTVGTVSTSGDARNHFDPAGAVGVVRGTDTYSYVLAYEGTARTVIMGSDLDYWYGQDSVHGSPQLVDNAIIWAVEGKTPFKPIDPMQYDVRYVEISTDGVIWYTLWDSKNGSLEEEWYKWTWGLPPVYGGKNIQVRFRFDSVDAKFNDYLGWYVDNVQIAAYGGNQYIKPAGEGVVQGPAPSAKVIAIGDSYAVVNDMQGMYDAYTFLAYGVDGKPNTGDEFVQIVSMSYGDGSVHNDGWDWESRLLSYYNQQYLPNTTLLASSGNGGHGFGTINAPQGNTAVSVGASTQYGAFDTFGGGLDLSQINDGDVQPFSGRGPDALGRPDPDVLATGAWGAGDTSINYAYVYPFFWGGYIPYPDGGNAWYEWGGTSRSAPEAAGVLALAYNAYYSATASFPTFETARQILMSSADDLNHDVLMQGAGRVNADQATNVAGALSGVYVSPSLLAAGHYSGTHYESFGNILYPGETWTQAFTVNNRGSAAATVAVSDEILSQMQVLTYTQVVTPYMGLEDDTYPDTYYYYADYFVGGNPVTTTHGADLAIPVPAGADLMQVQLLVPFEVFDFDYKDPDPYSVSYAQDQRWSLTVYDWEDRDGNGKLWEDANGDGIVNPQLIGPETVDIAYTQDVTRTEINRFAYSYNYANEQEVTVRLGDRTDVHNIVLGIVHRYPNDFRDMDTITDTAEFYQENPLQVKVIFYQKADWDMVTEDASSVSVPANSTATFNATFTISATQAPGLYEGAIVVDDGAHKTLIPTTVNVAVPKSSLLFTLGGTPDAVTPYDNGRMTGGWQWYSVLEEGDWRFYYYDADAGFAQQYLYVRNQWGGLCGNMPTFNETLVWGPNPGDQFSLKEPAKFGPYGLQYAGGTWDANGPQSGWYNPRRGDWWYDGDGTALPESRAWATLWDGLNQVQFRNILLSGKQQCGEGFQATAGVFGVDAPETGIDINTDKPSGSFTLKAVSPVDGLIAYPSGFGTEQFWQNQIVPQGRHFDSWPADLLSGWVYTFTAQNVSEIWAQTQGPGSSDIDLYLLYDANGDGLFNPVDNRERLASSESGDSYEEISYYGSAGIPFVADGVYAVVMYGYWVTPGDKFDLRLRLYGGDNLSIEGANAANNYVLSVTPGVPVDLKVNWRAPGPGIWHGYLYFGTPWEGEPKYWYQGPWIYVPVTLDKEGSMVDIKKTVSQKVAKWGDVLTYTVTVKNPGANVVSMDVSDLLPQGLDFVGDEDPFDPFYGITSTLMAVMTNYFGMAGCDVGYDGGMRTVHYWCHLPIEFQGKVYTEDKITFRARVEAQPGTRLRNVARVSWYGSGGFVTTEDGETEPVDTIVPLETYLPVILK